jgi:Zinc carboxypeptidase
MVRKTDFTVRRQPPFIIIVMVRFLRGVVVLLAALPGTAQPRFETWPGISYDPRIPAMRQVLGYETGERVTRHSAILKYLEALEAAAPTRMKIFDYGRTWEGRRLVYAAVGSEATIRNLSEIRAAAGRLADPRKASSAEAKRIMAALPAVVWLSYGVHGNEISSPDAALLTAYHLLAARGDRMVDDILAHVLILIDPVQNPDGRDRFVNYFEGARGLEPDPNPIAAEHQEPWPGGRPNHYLFDLNRDWIALTQPEIRDQVKVLREWFPLVAVDLHEMSGESTYFFSPESDPYNPNLTRDQKETLQLFGKNNARWFDHFGFDYFTRENYDAFYPGYGASWPSYYGAIAMTYEQASAHGLVVRRSDDTLLAFRDTVRHHFVASLSTLEAAAANREKLLGDFYRYAVTAIEEGRTEPVKEYILPRSRDASATDKLAGILVQHGIEVRRAAASFRSGGREYPAGTYVVPMAQPAKRLIRTLLDPSTPMDPHFVAAEEARRRQGQRSEIYDVTAWSLPLMFNVEAVAGATVSQGDFSDAGQELVQPGALRGPHASVAYLAPWGSEAAGRLLAAALREDLKVYLADRPFAQNGVKFPAGSLIFKVAGNPPDLGERLARLARTSGADISATDSGWVEDGVNFGSRHVVPLRKPAIAIAWDSPVSSGSAGAARFVLERQYGYPVTPVRTAMLASSAFARSFQVLILPEGGDYAEELGEDGIARLKAWVESGGTVVALGSAINFLSDSRVGLLELKQEKALRESEEKETTPPEKSGKHAEGMVAGTRIASESDLERFTRAGADLPDNAPGALLRARVRPDHWLTVGVPETLNLMVEGRAIYSPVKADRGVNAVYFDAPGQLVVSGHLWSENQQQIAYKPAVVAASAGRGVVVAFTQDPNFRAMLDGANVLFLNAVFRGPAHARGSGTEE